MQILRIDASARRTGSVTRRLADRLVARLQALSLGATVVHRDLVDGLPLLDEATIAAIQTPDADRTQEQQNLLTLSDTLVAELQAADHVVIAVPIYNFGVPAALKAWVDLVARARLTFRYTPGGPVGLLADRKTYIVTASGGTEVEGSKDFGTGFLHHILGFIGIKDVEVIAADRAMVRGPEAIVAAEAQIDAIGRPHAA